MHLIVYFALIYSSSALFIKDDQIAGIKILQRSFNDSLSVYNDESEAADCACENGRCVRDNRGQWKCLCSPRYAPVGDFKCAECDCGSKGKCFFNEKQGMGQVRYEKRCLCEKDFVEKDGKCFPCVCGKNSKCEFEDEEKICYCEAGFAELYGVCEECNCGEGGICEFMDPKKHCTCRDGFLLNGEKCEECDCGVKSTMCKFNEQGRKECSCEEKHAQNKEGICAVICSNDQECANGGNCRGEGSAKFCRCKPGTSGPKCETVEDCTANGKYKDCKGENGTCVYDNVKREALCRCNGKKKLHPLEKICLDCSCGVYAKSCRFGAHGRTLCKCKDGYAVDKDGICTECTCGKNFSCRFGANNERLCTCQSGFAYKDRYCKDCNCGERSTACNFNEDGKKECSCKEKNAQNRAGICADCSCGVYTDSCRFGANDRKQCNCKDGYAVDKYGICTVTCSNDQECAHGGNCRGEGSSKFCRCKPGTSGPKCETIEDCRPYGKYKDCKGQKGTCVYDEVKQEALCRCSGNKKLHPLENICRDCNCGERSTGCKFNKYGKKECSCIEKNAQNKAGICADCSCGVWTESCGFGAYDRKLCKCKDGYAVDKYGICTECTCGKNFSCRFGANNERLCSCQKGYAYKDGYCRSIRF